jgi:hypothetical protein
MGEKRTSKTRAQPEHSSKETHGLIAKEKTLQQSARSSIVLDNRSHRTKQG